MSRGLLLEDFSTPKSHSAQILTPDDLAAEYQCGFEAGKRAGYKESMSALSEALKKASAAIENETQIRRAAIHETLSAVTPVIQAIVEHLSHNSSDRLIATITSELERLCLAGIVPVCRISAEADLCKDVNDRVMEIGLEGITILPGTLTEITFDYGRIKIDPNELVSQIATLLTELSPDEDD